MPRVLLLATTTGYQTRAFGEAAERLGVDLVYATDRCHNEYPPLEQKAEGHTVACWEADRIGSPA